MIGFEALSSCCSIGATVVLCVDGGHAEYVLGAAPYVGRLPEGADLIAVVPIPCAGVTTYKGLQGNRAKARVNGW